MSETRTTSRTGGMKGTKLARFDLIPTGPLRELAEHFGVGASKYADHQWRKGYEWSKSYAALMRHLNAFWNGQDFDVCSNDPEGCSQVDADGKPFTATREDACFNHTGSHHMAAVAWHAFALLEFKDAFPDFDDRHEPEGDGDPDGRFYIAPVGTGLEDTGWTELGYIDDAGIFADAAANEATFTFSTPVNLQPYLDAVEAYSIPKRFVFGMNREVTDAAREALQRYHNRGA
jgi:hypothetical protein